MIDTVEELSKKKNVYILYESIYVGDNKMLWAMYKVFKSERKGVGKFWVQMKTSSTHKWFPKTLNVAGTGLYFNCNPFVAFDDKEDMIKYFCKAIKKNPDKNPKLTTKMKNEYPHYFI